jgi:hypothetical protein
VLEQRRHLALDLELTAGEGRRRVERLVEDPAPHVGRTGQHEVGLHLIRRVDLSRLDDPALVEPDVEAPVDRRPVDIDHRVGDGLALLGPHRVVVEKLGHLLVDLDRPELGHGASSPAGLSAAK